MYSLIDLLDIVFMPPLYPVHSIWQTGYAKIRVLLWSGAHYYGKLRTPNPWGLELLGSFAHVLYDTVSCSDDEKSKGIADGTLVAWGGRPWYGFEERLPSKDPVLITPNGRPLTTGYKQEVYRKRCYIEPSGRVALRVCIGPKIK